MTERKIIRDLSRSRSRSQTKEDKKKARNKLENLDYKNRHSNKSRQSNRHKSKQVNKEIMNFKTNEIKNDIINHEHKSQFLSTVMYKYRVIFEPDVQSKLLKQDLIRQHDYLFKNSKAFDGLSLYLYDKLNNDRISVKSKSTGKFGFKHGILFTIQIEFSNEIQPFSNEYLNGSVKVLKQILR